MNPLYLLLLGKVVNTIISSLLKFDICSLHSYIIYFTLSLFFVFFHSSKIKEFQTNLNKNYFITTFFLFLFLTNQLFNFTQNEVFKNRVKLSSKIV